MTKLWKCILILYFMKTTDRGYFTVFTRQYLQKYYILKKNNKKIVVDLIIIKMVKKYAKKVIL